MQSTRQTIFNRCMDWALDRRSIHRERVRALAPALGSILRRRDRHRAELGAYPDHVRAITSITLEERLDERARRRADARGILVTHVSGDAEGLPFRDASFDTVVSTFLLCSVDDPPVAVREFARVVRPGGNLLFLEHVISDHTFTRGLQRLAEVLHDKLSCGCSLTRDTQSMIAENGFAVQELIRHDLRGMLWIARPVIRGRASPIAAAAAANVGREASHA